MFVRLLFVSVLFFIPFGVFGENATFPDFFYSSSRSWTTSSGLPHNSVTSFYRDENGLLWAGTVEGLVRIDSKSSKIFNTNTNSAILSNKINDLSGCKEKVFVASATGISEISDSGEKVEKLFEGRGFFDVEAMHDCTLMATDGKEIFEIKLNKINKLNRPTDVSESGVTVLFSDGTTLYAGFESGELLSFGEGGFSQNLCAGNSSAVTAGRAAEGRIFVGNSKGSVFEVKGKKCEKIYSADSGEAVNSLDIQGETLVFTAGGTLFLAENGTIKPCGGFCDGSGFASKAALDGEFVWLSGSRGITLFYPGKFMTYGRETGLFSEKVYAVLEDNAGRVWTGTRGGGLFVYENGKFRYLKDRKGEIGRFAGGLMQNGDGNILVGTPNGIVSLDPDNPVVFKRMKEVGAGSMGAVSAIFRDKKSRLWAGGSGGAIHLNTKNGWRLIRKFGDDSDFVSAIAEDSRGNLWFAASKGLWQLDGKDEFHEINQGVDGSVPVSIFIDENDVVFVGSMHRGVTLIFPDLKTAQLDSRKGLCSDTVFGIIGDDDGNLWFSSTNGIFSLPKKDVFEAAGSETLRLSCIPFDATDGIRRPESTGGVQPSILKRKNGDLWFPTLEGVAVLKKEGRVAVKFDSVAPEKPLAVEKSEEKSDSYLVWVFLAVLAAGVVVFAVKRSSRPHPRPLSSVARGEEAAPDLSADLQSSAPPPQGSQIQGSRSQTEEDLTPDPSPVWRGEEGAEDPAELYDVNAEVVENVEESDLFDPEAFDAGEKKKYEGYQLDEEIAAAYAAEVRELMEKEKLYRNPYLTLPELAKKLKLSANTLSQVLNGHCGQTFYNFVNTYRVEEVIAMMRDTKNDGKSILKLSIEAGFNTKSTFNNIFKRQTGLTPAEFRKNIANQEKKQ